MRARCGRRPALAGLVIVLGTLLVAPVADAAPSSLRTGFTDEGAYQRDSADRVAALRNTQAARGTIVRVLVNWADVAPDKPPSSGAARDPGWPGYRWAGFDEIVRDITAEGLRPLLTFNKAPAWAEGEGRPAVSEEVPAGAWRPDPAAYRLFAEAAARRYSGAFPDPATPGEVLPRIRYWQAWNEPNLTDFLAPQWRRVRGGRYKAESPYHYKRLLNAFYRGVNGVRESNLVISAGTAPFGDRRRGDRRIAPALFTRYLLCVSGRRRPRAGRRCKGGPAYLEALAHHPYPLGGPSRKAINRDDVVVPDMHKLTRPLEVAIRARHVKPRRRKQIWATEISWDSRPPDPEGVPAIRHARYLAGALNVLWRQGVNTVIWYLLRDEPRGQGYEFGLQSGVFRSGPTVADDRPKRAFTAFRFPFTASNRRNVATLWGLAPGDGRVTIEARTGGRWKRIRQLRARSNRMFRGRVRVRHGTLLRATWRDEHSISWPSR